MTLLSLENLFHSALTLHNFPRLFCHPTRDDLGNVRSDLSTTPWNLLTTYHTDAKSIT